MTVAKIQISVGTITFSGEGNEDWLEKQLDKLLKAAPELVTIKKDDSKEDDDPASNTHTGTLAAYISKKGAGSNQTKRFLATAEWLHLKGSKRLQTKDVAKALSDSNQKRLGNPADCLNKNVAKGYCEKDGESFYVTPEGKASLG